MSYYINIHHGSGVDESPENTWINITFTVKDYFYLRTDGALICFIIERIRERKFQVSTEPMDRKARWCISIPVSKLHKSMGGAVADALQLAEWYKVQILNGNASINRKLLFDRKPFNEGKECCRDNVCDRILHPEWWEDTCQETKDTSEEPKETRTDS